MNIRLIIPAAGGDYEIGPEELARPFMRKPAVPHPHLTLEDYFQAVKTFLTGGTGSGMEWAKVAGTGDVFSRGEGEWSIRIEKHGAFYHVARVNRDFQGKRSSYCLIAAIEDPGRRFLVDDFSNLSRLSREFGGADLPEVHALARIASGADRESTTWRLVLADWLEGFHEWHYGDRTFGGRQLLVWDGTAQGHVAGKAERLAIYRQTARILVRYYNPKTFERIALWHHAAGDFVVGHHHGSTRVRLTTVRRYTPMSLFRGHETLNPEIPLLYLLLETTFKTRIDKLDGVGKMVWADEDVLGPTLEGFLEGLDGKLRDGLDAPLTGEAFMALLKSFSKQELLEVHALLVPLLAEDSPEDFAVLRETWEEHVDALFKTIQNSAV